MDFRLVTETSAENPIEHDLELSSTGDLMLVDGADAIAQHLKVRLLFFLGEWFLDLREGVPYFQKVYVKNPSRLTLNSVFRQVILGTPGIVQLLSFNLDLDASQRRASLSFEAQLSSGGAIVFSDFIVEVV